MGDRKKLPESLGEKQEFQRQETINRVLRAISDIKNEGGKVTVSVLIGYTELSRSTFAKPHIRELLVEHGYVPIGEASSKKRNKKESDKDKTIAELRTKNAELEQDCGFLRGRLFLVMQR